MGEYVDKMATGSYFLETGSEPPYAISKEIIDNMI